MQCELWAENSEQYPYQKAVHQEPNPQTALTASQTPAAEARRGESLTWAQPK